MPATTPLKPILALALAALLLGLACPTGATTGDPLPGVDVLVRKKPGPKPTTLHVGASGGGSIRVEAGFFGPGSEPFVGTVDMESAHVNVGTVGHVDHGRYDLVEGPTPAEFDLLITPLRLRSTDPIAVTIDGIDSFFDIEVDLDAVGGDPLAPLAGQLSLPVGSVLSPGSGDFVVDSFFDIDYEIRFYESGSGNPAGGTLTGTMQLLLQEPDLPVTRLPEESGGNVVLGFDGTTQQPFSFSDALGQLFLGLEPATTEDPVATGRSSMGAWKARPH